MVICFAGPAEIGRDQARKCARCMFGVGGWPMTSDSSQFLRACVVLLRNELQPPKALARDGISCQMSCPHSYDSRSYSNMPCLYTPPWFATLWAMRLFPVKAGHVLHWGTKSNQNAGRNGGLLSSGRHTHGGYSRKSSCPPTRCA